MYLFWELNLNIHESLRKNIFLRQRELASSLEAAVYTSYITKFEFQMLGRKFSPDCEALKFPLGCKQNDNCSYAVYLKQCAGATRMHSTYPHEQVYLHCTPFAMLTQDCVSSGISPRPRRSAESERVPPLCRPRKAGRNPSSPFRRMEG